MGSPNWYADHPPACTCVQCEEARRTGAGSPPAHSAYRRRQRRRKRRVFITGLVILGTIIGVGTWAHLNGSLPPQIQETTDNIQRKIEAWLGQEENGVPAVATTATPNPTLTPDQILVPAPTALSTPTSETGSELSDYLLAERLTQRKINQFRASRGLTVLAPTSSLADVARAHSKDMFTRDFFDHVNPDGLEPQGRVEHAGLTDFACGENLHMVTDATQDDVEEIASVAFTGWLNSPGHYENIVEPTYDTGGVGVFVKSKIVFMDRIPRRYDIYVTHLLCKDISEYNKLREQYAAAQALYDQLKAEYETLAVRYKAIEDQYVNNEIQRSQLEEAYAKLETAQIQLNGQVEVVNDLVERMNAAAGN